MITFIFIIILIVGMSTALIFYFKQNNLKSIILLLSNLDSNKIIEQSNIVAIDVNDDKNNFNNTLVQAGINHAEYIQGRVSFGILGIVIAVVAINYFSFIVASLGIIAGIVLIVFGGKFFLDMSKAERAKKIDTDLGAFLDLVNIILEAGGGLKNAFLQVSLEAKHIINPELIKEISVLEYEMTNYPTIQAYTNLKNRVDSENLAKIVDFLILSEQTGLAVKNIFSQQSDEMRQQKFYEVKGKVNTLNMYLMLVIFIFVLPALGAFIIFPMMAGRLGMGV